MELKNCTFPRLGDTGTGSEVAGSFIHSGTVWDWPVALLAERYAKHPCVVVTACSWLTLALSGLWQCQQSQCDRSLSGHVEPLRLLTLAGKPHYNAWCVDYKLSLLHKSRGTLRAMLPKLVSTEQQEESYREDVVILLISSSFLPPPFHPKYPV